MLTNRVSKATARLGASLTACLALAATANAQLDATILTLDQTAYEAGQIARMTLEAEPFHIPLVLLSASQGPTVVPGLGTFGIGITPMPDMFFLPRVGQSGKRTYTCNFNCNSALRDAPYYIEILTVDPLTGQFAGLSNMVIVQQVDGDCGACVEEAEGDDAAKYPAGHALYLPGIGTDFVFTPGGSFVERTGGTARMIGVVTSESDPSKSFAIDVQMTDRVDPLDVNHPPAGSPKLELVSGAYEGNGGQVDPRDWRYYETMTGILTGLDCLEGAIVQVDRRGPAFQVGKGANGKNVEWGGSGWLDYTTLAQPVACATLPATGYGDFNVSTHVDCYDCTEATTKHAVTMPAFGNKYKFVIGGEFEQFADGTARLAGVIENNDGDPLNRWSVDISFGNRMNPGSGSYPPAGSPKQELGSGSYVGGGGPVDPGTWHYYQDLQGTVTGLDDNAGDTIVLTRRGPAFQVGLGASGKNENYGASGWLDVAFYEAGSQNPSMSTGDINIDIGGDCEAETWPGWVW